MKNLKALALTALAATTFIIAAPKAEAGVAMCDQAFKTGYTGTCYDMNGKAWTNAQDWNAGTGFQGNVGATATMQPAPATTGFMDTVMGGLNEITGAGLGLNFNALANTNTTVEGPCATGTDRFGNTVCTDNNGVVQHEIRRDARGNQEYRF